MDHEPFLLTGTKEQSDAARTSGAPNGGMSVHGATARNFVSHAYYEHNNGQIRCGLSNVVYILADTEEGDGGLGFVPGSVSMQRRPTPNPNPYSLTQSNRHARSIKRITRCRRTSTMPTSPATQS